MTTSTPSEETPASPAADLSHFVIGGRYTDTSFSELLEAAPTQGPFERYEDAVDAWRGESMRHIDEAFVRYLIVRAETAEVAAALAEEPPSERAVRSA
jgi:hypothetical protein